MTDVENNDRSSALLPGAHRVVRALDVAEGPLTGVLVTRGDGGGVAVQVDADAIAGWVGWRFAGAEHVVGPVDVVRRSTGHDVLMPWCTDRVLGYLVRRTAAGSALSSGESSTLVASLLRGLDELGEGADGVRTGVWWLTESGRPTLVLGEGPDARESAAKVVQRLGEGSSDKALKRVLETVQQGLGKTLSQPRVPARLLAEWENELLQIAAPRPLQRDAPAPETAREVVGAVSDSDRGAVAARKTRRLDSNALGAAPGIIQRGPALSARMREAAGAAQMNLLRGLDAVRARVRSPPKDDGNSSARGHAPRRRRTLIVAGAAATAVLAGGLLWPGGDADGVAVTESTRSPAPLRTEDAASTPEPEATTADGDERDAGTIETEGTDASPDDASSEDVGADPKGAVSGLLKLVSQCLEQEDAVCAEAVAPDSAGVIDALAPTVTAAPIIELVDEYGDVAVVRLKREDGAPVDEGDTDPSAPDQMLVLVRQDEKWLVRDAYSVADQPG